MSDDIGKKVAIGTLIGVAGYAIYSIIKKSSEPQLTVELTASPYNVVAEEKVTLTCSVSVGQDMQLTTHCGIYEGSGIPGTGQGTFLAELPAQTKTVLRNQTTRFVFEYITTPGTTERRDVRIQILSGTDELYSNDFDDAFWVISGTGGGWRLRGEILDKKDFNVSIRLPEPGDWVSRGTVLDTKDFSVIIIPSDGVLSLNSAPSGATAIISGVNVGVTPIIINLIPGYYPIVLRLSNYRDWEGSAEIVAGQTVTISAVLTLISTPTVTFTVYPTDYPQNTQRWMLYYYDNFTGSYTIVLNWISITIPAIVSGVHSGGHLLCNLENDLGQQLGYPRSYDFFAQNGKSYNYFIRSGLVTATGY